MKKSLIALAVLGSMVGAAAAQSSVTLFGIVDANVRYNKGGGVSTQTMGNNGLASSRLGFRGVEDLGGGLKASFWIEHRFNSDTGTLSSSRFWHGRSTVSLSGDFGEVRMGRYLTPSWNAYADFDPFGTNGVGDIANLYSVLGSPADTKTRADNMVGYFLPGNLGGFYGEAAVAAGEGTAGGKYAGGRVGYAQGPINVNGGLSKTETTGGDFKTATAAGSYNFGLFKLVGIYSQNKYNARKQTLYTLGATMPLGSGTLRASYTTADANNAAKAASFGDADQFAVGYVYDLSKRTALYGTASMIKNKATAKFVVAGQNAALIKNNYDNGAVEVGIRHAF